ncbi:actin-histidine N-methyltransferase isoform X5 [Punica granatum]|uniref:Actin-histidine N-methyltransferase isoform X5 n=1 Tax=Punica granatum TaxID=22663 RepID=A0A6P8C0F5_PUNGR|nr:actin-histidine N-methyltransferase isoform X5 [Punica granatum]
MLLCIRITKLMVSPRRFFTAPRCLCSKLHSSSLSQSVASSYLHEECDDFLPWLEQKAGVAISSAVSIGRSTYGRSLFATKIIETGSSILKVPFHAQISPDNLYPEIKILLGDEVGNVARLATVILVEKKKGPESGWAPYISRLPLLGETQTTVLDQFPQIFDGIKFEDFLHAYTLVESRAWESSKGFSMVLADRDYAPGEQIWITYGKFSNATLLLEFGFTLPHNIHDEVHLHFKIPSHDPLYKMKSELLERLRFPTLKDLRGFKHHADSFTIKEVRSATGKGYGIPQSLRAAARVLCCTSAEELCYVVEEAMENDGRLGRRPFKNIEREIQAHEILLSQITTLIGEYTESIKLLVSTSPAGNRHDSRERMAHDLLAGELRVLKAASLWLQNYILTLHHSA